MTTLEAPRVDEDTTVLDQSMFDDIIPCVRCQGRATLAVIHRCCGNASFGCLPCEQVWEAHARMQFTLGELFGRGQRCGRCHTHHDSFESAFRIETI